MTLAAVAISVSVAAPAFAQSRTYKVLAAAKTSTMQKEMQEAGEAGFRFVAVMGGETAVGGKVVSEVIEGSRRSPVLLRYPEAARSSPPALGRLLIETPGGAKVPLALLADIQEVDGPVQITR